MIAEKGTGRIMGIQDLPGKRHRTRRPFRRRRSHAPDATGGFTLLELLIAMTILAVGMLGIMKLQMQSGLGNVASRDLSAAVNLARSKMEELRRINAYTVQAGVIPDLDDNGTTDDLADWSNPDFSDSVLLNEDADSSGGRKIFTRAWNVRHHWPVTNFKTVRIRVSWTTGGQEKHVDLETQIGPKDKEYFE